MKQAKRPDKYKQVKELIKEIFSENFGSMVIVVLRWYSKTGTQYRDKLFYKRGVSDEKTV